MTSAVRDQDPAAGQSTPDAAPAVPANAPASVGAADGLLASSRDAPVGGQAVLEGVMMRGVGHWAIAVRKPYVPPADAAQQSGTADVTDGAVSSEVAGAETASENDAEPLGEIEVQEFELESSNRKWLFKVPLLRGVVAMWGSLAIGMRALTISANAQMPESEAGEEPMELSGAVWGFTMLLAGLVAVGVFFILPVTLTNLVKHQLSSSVLFWIVEGLIRTVIFLGYMWVIARARDMRRVFEYHGAEHKVISCYEAGDELTPERARLYSRFHPRCGTSFLLIVMVVSIFVFAFTGVHAWWILVVTRIVGIPVVVGISFEVIKWAGRNRSRRWVQWIMAPGMQLQRLTTREPDLDQLAVAIASLNAVLAHEVPGDLSAEDLLGVEVVA